MLDRRSLDDQLRRNRRDTVLVLAAIAGLTSLAGWLVAGGPGVALALAGAALVLAFDPRGSVSGLRALYGAHPLPVDAAPGLWRLHTELCRRAGLERVPPLLHIPSRAVLALSTGWGRHCVVALSEGALAAFPPEELAAVLAHEISHIRSGDLKLLRLADAAGRLTHALAVVTLLLLAFMLPDMVEAGATLDLVPLSALVLAPVGCDLLRLGLSRTREFAADAGAAELCGTPAGLMAALARLEGGRWHWGRWHGGTGGWLRLIRTHPTTAERVARLRELAPPPPRLAFPLLVLPLGTRWYR